MIELPILLPYFVSLLLSIGICVYAWDHRQVPGAKPFTTVAFAQTLWILGFIFELLSPTLDGKIFWDNFQYLGVCLWLPALFVFTLQYTGRQLKRPQLTWTFIGGFETIFLLLVITSRWHDLIRSEITLFNTGQFLELSYDYPLPVWIFAAFLYGLLFTSIYYLADKLFHTHRLYRAQIAIILIGTFIPVAGITLSLLPYFCTKSADFNFYLQTRAVST